MARPHYVLVGSGIAALSAAEAIRRADAAARITMVSAEAHAFYSRPALAYYLARELPEARLAVRTATEIEELGLERLTGVASGLAARTHELRLGSGATIRYDRLLLAPGAASLPPPFEGAALEGVVRLDGLDDARAIAAKAVEGRRAVVTGGGSTALELAEAMAARGLQTHFVLRAPRYWPRVLDAAESARVQAGLEHMGIRVSTSEAITTAESDGRGRLRAVVTSEGRRLRCELLAVAIGVRPRAELARLAGLEVRRGIVVNDELRTSDPDIFAAGDAAETGAAREAGAGLDTLWASAARQGQLAGGNLAGGTARYTPIPALNITRLAGITTTIAGRIGGEPDADLQSLTRGQSERWQAGDPPVCVRCAGTLRLCVAEGRLVGAVVMGDAEASRAAVELVRARAPVHEQRLLEWREHHEHLPALLAAFHREWLGAGRPGEAIGA